MVTPFGNHIIGFKVRVWSTIDPASVERDYGDIEAITHANKHPLTILEGKDSQGHFKFYTVVS